MVPASQNISYKKTLIQRSIIVVGILLFLIFGYVAYQRNTQVSNEGTPIPKNISDEINKSVKVGDLDILVSTVFKELGENGKTFKVAVSIQNTGKRAETISPFNFQLVEDNGTTYESRLDFGKNALGTKSLNPGLKEVGYIAFDLPDYVFKVGLKIHSESSSEPVVVNLYE